MDRESTKSLSRRRFCEWLGGSGLLAGSSALFAPVNLPLFTQAAIDSGRSGSDIGSLYPFVQKQADRSRLELSFLRPEFRDLQTWQKSARAKMLEHLFYAPPPVSPAAEVIRRTDRGDYL